ncbi:MFS transporter [Streptomyces sp. ASQP_92]|uniref:MFS transporter n=1 Tax=Streptomyces sp. ASQP_92 TaxID=2979116 RepID=UPI0021C1B581|nr:MFS transporter [Streptomyces sp. ASQP_92]MCT9092585.1 MFS transporter [Streptomyces sp. ASQP_92]
MPSATTASAEPSTPPALRSTLLSWLAVLSVMMGIFAIVTTEILPIGLLTSIGQSFTISDGMAGLMMTMPGFLASISAPVVTVATGRIDRRAMLGAFVLLLALANFLAAAASSYWMMLVSRVLVGITIGGFWSIGAGLAGRLVPSRQVGRATSVIFSAVPLGSVLGVPLGTFIGSLASWRTTFLVMGVFALSVFVLLVLALPALPPERATRLRVLNTMLRNVNTGFALTLTFLIVLAHFGTYTYVTPFLQQVTHVSPALITLYLLVYGIAGIVGNFLGGATVARYPRGTFAAAASMLAGATLSMPVLGRWDWGAMVLLMVWGIAYGAVPVCSQTWFAKAAPASPEASSVVFTASFQATFSIGALVGGMVIDHASPSTLMPLGGCAAALAVLVVGFHRMRRITWPETDQASRLD